MDRQGQPAAADTIKIRGDLPAEPANPRPAGRLGPPRNAGSSLGADIVNNRASRARGALPLAPRPAGLPNLGGAKIELINVDHQGNRRRLARNQDPLRLITQDKVVAMLGAYHSSVGTGGNGGRRSGQGIPFLVGDSVRAQYYRPRLQMDFPHRTDPHPTSAQRLHPIPQRT